MSQETHGVLTFTAGEALAQYRRVKLDGSTAKQVVYADAGDHGIGTVRVLCASGDLIGITPHVWEGTQKMVAAGVIAVNTEVFAAADGKIQQAPCGERLGIALEAAAGDGHVIEVMPLKKLISGPGPGVHGFHYDFTANSLDDDVFVVTASDGGAGAFADGAGGVIQLQASDTTVGDNDETYVHQTLETFLFAAGKPLVWQARIKLTEGATDKANVMVGLANAWAANHIQDNGAGPVASYSGHVAFKVDGGTVWQSEGSIATTQTTDTDIGTRSSGTWVTFRGEFDPGSGVTDGRLRMFLDGALVQTITSFDYTNATEMELGCGVKNGTTTEELVDIDYLSCYQAR